VCVCVCVLCVYICVYASGRHGGPYLRLGGSGRGLAACASVQRQILLGPATELKMRVLTCVRTDRLT
jgi:hypothetical protein